MAHIKTYARLKPSRKPYPGYEVENNTLKIHITDNKELVFIDPLQVANRGTLSYEVSFTEIFCPDSTQEEVFSVAAKDIIQNFLNGYNGTIFAYGQTGTGKTYTVEGNTNLFCRGLSTRALNMIYQQLARRIDDHISVYLSYLEIYQEVAYDLLNPTSRPPVPIFPFTKVTTSEGLQESYMLRGLTLHQAASEDVALMLLRQGQANRKIAETPTNQRSSRSHAVFTVYLQARRRDSKVTLKSKLHLVDLAGSERVSKTGADGLQLTEAKSINLSLHHLETVIIALQSDRNLTPNSASGEDKSMEDNVPSHSRSMSLISGPSSDGSRHRQFVPYRNSLLTMLLKDSLGGNCLTAMIATISMEPENVGESLSTCRFAQRVARVANNARRNEEIDDKALISKLLQKIACMKQELACVKSLGEWRYLYSRDNLSSVLSQEDRAECARIMDGFLQGTIPDPLAVGICDRYRFLECLHVLKERCLQSQDTLSQILTGQQQMEISPSPCSEIFLESCDCSGDQRMTGIFQTGTTTYFAGYQQNAEFTMSEGSMDVSEEFFSASEYEASACIVTTATECSTLERRDAECSTSERKDAECSTSERKDTECSTSERKDTECSTSERKDSERSSSSQEHSEAKPMISPKRIKLKVVKNTDRTARKRERQTGSECHIRFEKLLDTESTLRTKLKDLELQLAEHQTHIQWLKDNQADPVRIARELIVGTNQQKCQARFQERLNKLLERKAKLLHSLSFERQKSPFIRQCCNKSPNNGRSSPCHLKCNTPNIKQESPKVNYEKSAWKSKDLTFKVAASLNRCRDFRQSQQTPPPSACHQLQRSYTLQQADEDQQETPTIAKQCSYRELQQRISEVSCQFIDQEPQTYPAVSRRQSGKGLRRKTRQISNLHLDQEQQKHPAISRQNASHKFQQKATQVSNQLFYRALSAISRQHMGKDVQRKTRKVSNQHATQEQENTISDKMSRQNGGLEIQQKSPKFSFKTADKQHQKHPRMIFIKQYGVQQKMPTLSKQLTEQQQNQWISNHNGDQEQQKVYRISRRADYGLQQVTSKIFKHDNPALQQRIPSKQNGDDELQQNPRTLQHISQDLQQKTQRIARQHSVQKLQQNARMSKQSAEQIVQQKTSKKPKQLVNQEPQVSPEEVQQTEDVYVNSRNHVLQEESIAGSPPEGDRKSTVSFAGDNSERNVTKVESSSDGSECTEKQVNTFDEFLVSDDKENTDYEN